MKKRIIIIGAVIVALVVAVVIFVIIQKPAAAPTASVSTQSDGSIVTKTANNSKFGDYLTDGNGNTLYTYSSDTAGVSNCVDVCINIWPAYIDASGSTTGLPANIGTVTRNDSGALQYTYKGLPLYTFVSDSKGKVTGDGVSGFNVAKP